MSQAGAKAPVKIIGGGMITQIQLLPAIYHMQRRGLVGEIDICALNAAPLAALKAEQTLKRAFPGQDFTPFPDPEKVGPDEKFPELYREVLGSGPAGAIAVIAVPDQFHYEIVKEAILNDLHVCVVKPLVLKYAQAEELKELAYQRGVSVGIEYHKRFDDRNLLARSDYRAGRLGNFRLAQAQMIEPYYYRDSNFQNWCTRENSDMFTYVGCHYVDLIAFITGLKPVSVSVYGVVDKYPNGNEGYLWTDGRVIWENGGCLSVVDAIGYPNAAAGGNYQGLAMWGQGDDDATLLVHSDQYRGVKVSYNSPGQDVGDTQYGEPSADYFKLIDLGGDGLTPVGYGYRSVEFIVEAGLKVAAAGGLKQRQETIKQYDVDGIMATPANSSYNELVIEAGRKSIQAGGKEVAIDYGKGTVDFK